ncbi:MAG: hypothetical protein IPG45_33595 [Deltaproteobacteria bacterium]|nr:hypothetical protein [Deltaproteobacteria bacterium]
MSTRSYDYTPEVHCVYPDSACDPDGGRLCPAHGEDPGVCVFQAGEPTCQQDPGPVP